MVTIIRSLVVRCALIDVLNSREGDIERSAAHLVPAQVGSSLSRDFPGLQISGVNGGPGRLSAHSLSLRDPEALWAPIVDCAQQFRAVDARLATNIPQKRILGNRGDREGRRREKKRRSLG